MSILIGADPEFFVRKATKSGRGQFISAHDLVPGTKEAPYKVEHGAVQVDGMALEYNIDPASSAEEFVFNNLAVLTQLKKMVGPGLEFVFNPVCHFSDRVWANASEEEQVLGCTPDFNAYTGEQNPVPNNKAKFRTASGHIHIGWTEGAAPDSPEHFADCQIIIRELDTIFSWIYHDQCNQGLVKKVDELKRRRLYGRAGAFRPKSYGCEYRTPSNTWLKTTQQMETVFNAAHAVATRLIKEGPVGHNPSQERLINNGRKAIIANRSSDLIIRSLLGNSKLDREEVTLEFLKGF